MLRLSDAMSDKLLVYRVIRLLEMEKTSTSFNNIKNFIQENFPKSHLTLSSDLKIQLKIMSDRGAVEKNAEGNYKIPPPVQHISKEKLDGTAEEQPAKRLKLEDETEDDYLDISREVLEELIMIISCEEDVVKEEKALIEDGRGTDQSRSSLIEKPITYEEGDEHAKLEEEIISEEMDVSSAERSPGTTSSPEIQSPNSGSAVSRFLSYVRSFLRM